jgi:hypothetical protein
MTRDLIIIISFVSSKFISLEEKTLSKPTVAFKAPVRECQVSSFTLESPALRPYLQPSYQVKTGD